MDKHIEELRGIIKYQIEGRGGKINPKDDFVGFINDILAWKRKYFPSAKEIVICAAIKYKDGTIIRGHRHGDCAFDCDRPLNKDFKGCVQGFITSKNRFVTREEGRKLQDAAGIKSVDGYRSNTLFSEDLY